MSSRDFLNIQIQFAVECANLFLYGDYPGFTQLFRSAAKEKNTKQLTPWWTGVCTESGQRAIRRRKRWRRVNWSFCQSVHHGCCVPLPSIDDFTAPRGFRIYRSSSMQRSRHRLLLPNCPPAVCRSLPFCGAFKSQNVLLLNSFPSIPFLYPVQSTYILVGLFICK